VNKEKIGRMASLMGKGSRTESFLTRGGEGRRSNLFPEEGDGNHGLPDQERE